MHVTATVIKGSKEEACGIVFQKRRDGQVVISQIHEGRLFSSSPLRAGMKLFSFNGIEANSMDVATIDMILKNAVGEVTIVAENGSSQVGLEMEHEVAPAEAKEAPEATGEEIVIATIIKSSQDAAVGIDFAGTHPDIRIANIHRNALCSATKLEPGMILVSVNDMAFYTSAEVVEFLREALGTITFAAKRDIRRAPAIAPRVFPCEPMPRPSEAPPMDITQQMPAYSQLYGFTPPSFSQLDPFSSPPPGAPEGGIWGTGKYVGGNSHALAAMLCCIFGFAGLVALCFKLDDRDMYLFNNSVYDRDGKILGGAEDCDFRPNQPGQQHMRKGVTKSQAEQTCGPDYKRKIWCTLIGCQVFCIALVVIFYVVIFDTATAYDSDSDDDY